MTRIHANNFITSTNGAITDSGTSIILTSVTGFPVIGAGVTCNVTLQNGSDIEIVTATARSSFTLTVTRGAESTVAKAFASGSTASIRPTADSVDRKADIASPVFTGTVTIPTPFTLGAVSVLPTGTELNFVDGVTSNIQTQIDAVASGTTPSYTTTATAAGTTTLTASSTKDQFFTGVTTQTCVLPVTSTLSLGRPFRIVNNSTGVVTVQSSGANTVVAMAALTELYLTCILTSGTTAASWDFNYSPNGSLITGTGSGVRAASPTFTGTVVLPSGQALIAPALGTIASGDLSAGTGSLVNLTTITTSANISINGLSVGRGGTGTTTNTNCAFGVSALAANATDDYNVAFGYHALMSVTSGGSNLGMGGVSLDFVTTGVGNVGFGFATGRAQAAGQVAITTGNNNICIGSSAGVNAAAAVGVIAIGAEVVGDTSTGSGSGDLGAGIAIGSAVYKVGFAGDGSIIQTAGSSVGYWRVKLNGTYYKFLMLADS